MAHHAPECALCGAAMVQRVGRYGKFFGCSDFPRCRGTKEVRGGQTRFVREAGDKSTAWARTELATMLDRYFDELTRHGVAPALAKLTIRCWLGALLHQPTSRCHLDLLDGDSLLDALAAARKTDWRAVCATAYGLEGAA